MADDDVRETPGAEEADYAQDVKEKGARRVALPAIQSWPTDADGNPMAIVAGQFSETVPTVRFGNVEVGPVLVMRPVTNDETAIHEFAVWCQRESQFIVATERRAVQWALDPSLKILTPQEIQAQVHAAAQQPQAAPEQGKGEDGPSDPAAKPAAENASPTELAKGDAEKPSAS